MNLEVKSLCFSYGKERVLKDIDFTSRGGESVAVLGPNGVGKITFFKCLLGFLSPEKGEILVDGKNIGSISPKELSSLVAYIPQSSSPVYNHTVLHSVAMGLTSRMGLFSVPGEKEYDEAEKALLKLGILHLKDRGCKNISGGERQLMLIARALVQNAKILLMDEPTANLDYGNSFRVMETIVKLANDGYTVLFSTHDPDSAMRYANRVIAFGDGRIIRDGSPRLVLTGEVLSTLYSINVALRNVKVRDKEYPVCIPTGHDTTPSSGCIVVRDKEVLLVRFSRRIGFPKGHQENGESLEATAIRETEEETGIRARITDPLPLSVPSVRPGDQRSVYFFISEYESGETRPQNGETEEAFWVKEDDVISLLSFDSDKVLFSSVLEKRKNMVSSSGSRK